MFIVSALSNMGTWNQVSCNSKMQPFCKLDVCASAPSCLNVWKSNYPHRHVNVIALHVFMAATVKLPKFVISEPDFSPSEQGSNWQHQLRLSNCDTLWCQHYVTTGKEYLINCHTLLQYFESVFLQLQLVQILCKLITIWVNYKKKQQEVLFKKTPCRVDQQVTFKLHVHIYAKYYSPLA